MSKNGATKQDLLKTIAFLQHELTCAKEIIRAFKIAASMDGSNQIHTIVDLVKACRSVANLPVGTAMPALSLESTIMECRKIMEQLEAK